MNNEYSFHILSENNADEIVSLRKRSYSNQFNCELSVEGLLWNKTDQNSVHLGLLNKQSELVSTIRITFFQNKESLENSTSTPTPKEVVFPCALLSRAATNPEHSMRGLHQALRLISLEHIAKTNCHCVLGTMKKNTPRLRSLLEIGYVLICEADNWMNSFIKSNDPVVLIGLINESQIKEAINQLRKRIAHNFTSKISYNESHL